MSRFFKIYRFLGDVSAQKKVHKKGWDINAAWATLRKTVEKDERRILHRILYSEGSLFVNCYRNDLIRFIFLQFIIKHIIPNEKHIEHLRKQA